jgi:HSP20 family protein
VHLPGYDSDDVEITSARNTLTISGRRQQPELSDKQAMQRCERHYGEFVRTFEIPFDVDPEKTNATFDKGVLLVSLEAPEQEKKRKIEIKAG